MTGRETPSPDPPPRRRILYGRRKGRPLRPARQALVDGLLRRIRVPLPGRNQGGAVGKAGLLDPRELFAGPQPFDAGPAGPFREVWLEVGFGAGEHLAAQAEANPEIAFIGCEPFLNGVAAALARIDRGKLNNVRIYDDDARVLLDHLAPGSLGRVFILFPDPWPKTRHARRRFLSAETLDTFARVMARDAELRFATDDPVCLRWALSVLIRHPEFAWRARSPADWRHRPADQPPSRYEEKARAKGATPVFLVFARV
ncbi:MAG: tRNA (guanosine(46)-N7)-methyltransferase TrmB [Alphaproteobacteria bacterium]|nr:tRNA (guanosine(46)-N7)-methyltransferase TrmB [Alphaproteobacteria bacterium]